MGTIDEKEQEYLDFTLKAIDEDISQLEENCESGYDDVHELSKYHWETKSEMDYFEKAVTMNDVNHRATVTNSALSKLRSLRKASDSPYFGKIKVDFDGDQDEFYIGRTSIMKDNNLIVNDWRSPIATLFYNSKTGKTSYKAPVGKIECDLLQRKQIRIKNRKIENIVDTDIHLSDIELQRVLSEKSDGKMKSIATTIQEEQDEVIRDMSNTRIIVQGCAGSGKTSVALHRLSFMLYNDTSSTAENMLIFSPSDTFSSYISNVLPDLGDDNVYQTTFSDFARAYINKFDKIETFSEFLSTCRDGKLKDNPEQDQDNRFKYSKEYKEALDEFIQNHANSYRFRDDLSVLGIMIPFGYLNRILDGDTNSSLQEKIDMITDEIYNLLRNKGEFSKKSIRSAVASSLVKPDFNPRAVYNKFLQSEEYNKRANKYGTPLNKKFIGYPDLIGLLYMTFEFMGYPNTHGIHHLVVDEVQDYSPLQMEMIVKMFSGASITVLGDSNQTVNPYHKYDSLIDLKEQLGSSARYIELNKAYRSSPEIMNYVKKILGDDKIEPVRVSSGNPVVLKEVSKEELFTVLVQDILKLKEKGFENICIVTKSSKEARAIFEGLCDSIDNICVISDDKEYKGSTLISTAYNAKGLEFDAVICFNDLENTYTEEEKYLYYVACTRAQHELVVYNEPKQIMKENAKALVLKNKDDDILLAKNQIIEGE